MCPSRSDGDGIDNGRIFVSANFCHGNQGKLAPSRIEVDSDSADLGQLDRDLVMKWVRENIHL